METKTSSNFIKNIVIEDLHTGKHKEIITRFPPEPNGYLHIGHAKSIVLNFELADEFKGKTNLRFDDTNPVKEDTEYVDSIEEDVIGKTYTLLLIILKKCMSEQCC
jgi:glutaminyl-tRNA synthetase